MPVSPIKELKAVFDVAAAELPAAGVECLLVGGFAVNHYGYTRNTLDVDWLIVAEQRGAVLEIMRRKGFTNITVHENVMFFQRPGATWRVDFLQTDRATLEQMMSRAETVVVHGATVNVPALKDLIAMKLFSLAQNPEQRMGKDLPDIACLAVLNGLDPEQDIHPVAARYASEAVFKMVADQIRALQS